MRFPVETGLAVRTRGAIFLEGKMKGARFPAFLCLLGVLWVAYAAVQAAIWMTQYQF